MIRVEILTDVPESKRDQVVEDFQSAGAQVSTKKQADGNWVVVAVFAE